VLVEARQKERASKQRQPKKLQAAKRHAFGDPRPLSCGVGVVWRRAFTAFEQQHGTCRETNWVPAKIPTGLVIRRANVRAITRIMPVPRPQQIPPSLRSGPAHPGRLAWLLDPVCSGDRAPYHQDVLGAEK